jgi:hypothetical protein
MGDNPNFVNLNFTSFGKKEEYKPPTGSFFKAKQTSTRQKHIPGGEWAQEEAPEEQQQPVSAQVQQKKPENTTTETSSKFSFIRPKKEEAHQSPAPPSQLSVNGLLEFSEVRKES